MKLGYARSATDEAKLKFQIDELKTAGCEKIWSEVGSGINKKRPQLIEMLDQASTGDTIIVCDYARLSRSQEHFDEFTRQFDKSGIALLSLSQPALPIKGK